MKTSSEEETRAMYDQTAEGYAELMDSEIHLPIYAETLKRLSESIDDLPGYLLDTSCGSGHMLAMYRERFDRDRPLLGIDLSPQMVAIAQSKLGPSGKVSLGDMRDLSALESESAAAVLSYFAVHHLNPEEVQAVLKEWHRVLALDGRLVVAAWEGTGTIDYGESSKLIALRYQSDQLLSWAQAAGYRILRCVTEPVEEMPMDAIYFEAVKD